MSASCCSAGRLCCGSRTLRLWTSAAWASAISLPEVISVCMNGGTGARRCSCRTRGAPPPRVDVRTDSQAAGRQATAIGLPHKPSSTCATFHGNGNHLREAHRRRPGRGDPQAERTRAATQPTSGAAAREPRVPLCYDIIYHNTVILNNGALNYTWAYSRVG